MSFTSRNLMIKAIELTRYSKVPVLFLGNPGFGKTTVVELWAKKNGFHVETLCADGFDRCEIGGYQIYNQQSKSDFLELAKPYWFHNIELMEEKGIPSILFIDEISTAPPDVQGAIFRLIFSRCLQNGTKLPESTLILSAANYKDNLPSYFDITAPTLNRFCIINIGFENFSSMIDEFLNDSDDLMLDWPVLQFEEIGEEKRFELKRQLRNFFNNLISNYMESYQDFTKGFLDINNKNYSNLYDSDMSERGEVLNFISGRTISFLYRCCATFLGLKLSTNDDLLSKMIDGLIGIGTNTFKKSTDEAGSAELRFYRNYIKRDIKLILDVISGTRKEVSVESLFDDCTTISEKIMKLNQYMDSITNNSDLTLLFMAIYSDINNEYPIEDSRFVQKIEELSIIEPGEKDLKLKLAKFKSDIDSIDLLTNAMFNGPREKIIRPFIKFLQRCLRYYEFYYTKSI